MPTVKQELEEVTDDCQISHGIFTLTHEKSTSFDEKVIDEIVSSFSYLDDNIFSHYQKNIL